MSGPVLSTLRRRAPPSLLAWANRITSFVPPPPAPEGGKDRIIVVQVHPYGKEPSFTLALGDAVRDSLTAAGVQMFTSGAIVAKCIVCVVLHPPWSVCFICIQY